MRLFFVAVSQGVVQHLRDNPGAFRSLIRHHAQQVGEDGTGTASYDDGGRTLMAQTSRN